MKNPLIPWRTLVLGAICLWLWLPAPVRADVLEIPGTGACEVLLREVANAFNARHPEHRVSVPRSIGTVGGMRLVTSDQAVLVRVGRPLTPEEKDQGLTYLPFAKDLVVFAVGAKVPVRGITTAQLKAAYNGTIKNWRELGGPQAPIRLLLRQPGDASLLIIEKHLEYFRQIAFPSGAKVVYTDPDMLALLQKYDYSLGWLTLSSLEGAKTPVYPLALDGVAPSRENARARKYELLGEYALVFKERQLPRLARIFLDFLFSEEGRIIIERLGAISLPGN